MMIMMMKIRLMGLMGRPSGGLSMSRSIRNNVPDFYGVMSEKVSLKGGKSCNQMTKKRLERFGEN